MGHDSAKPDLENYLLDAVEGEDDLHAEDRPDGVLFVDWEQSAVDAFEAVQSALPEGAFWFEMLDEEETRFRLGCGKREQVVELPGVAAEDGGDGVDAMSLARDVLRPDYDLKVISFTADSDAIGFVVATSAFFDGFARNHPDEAEELFVELEDLEAAWEEEFEDDDYGEDDEEEVYEDE